MNATLTALIDFHTVAPAVRPVVRPAVEAAPVDPKDARQAEFEAIIYPVALTV